jgi:hypothetical protein
MPPNPVFAPTLTCNQDPQDHVSLYDRAVVLDRRELYMGPAILLLLRT